VFLEGSGNAGWALSQVKVTIYAVFDDEVELHLLAELLMRPGK
jgi:hypothetical protein